MQATTKSIHSLRSTIQDYEDRLIQKDTNIRTLLQTRETIQDKLGESIALHNATEADLLDQKKINELLTISLQDTIAHCDSDIMDNLHHIDTLRKAHILANGNVDNSKKQIEKLHSTITDMQEEHREKVQMYTAQVSDTLNSLMQVQLEKRELIRKNKEITDIQRINEDIQVLINRKDNLEADIANQVENMRLYEEDMEIKKKKLIDEANEAAMKIMQETQLIINTDIDRSKAFRKSQEETMGKLSIETIKRNQVNTEEVEKLQKTLVKEREKYNAENVLEKEKMDVMIRNKKEELDQISNEFTIVNVRIRQIEENEKTRQEAFLIKQQQMKINEEIRIIKRKEQEKKDKEEYSQLVIAIENARVEYESIEKIKIILEKEIAQWDIQKKESVNELEKITREIEIADRNKTHASIQKKEEMERATLELERIKREISTEVEKKENISFTYNKTLHDIRNTHNISIQEVISENEKSIQRLLYEHQSSINAMHVDYDRMEDEKRRELQKKGNDIMQEIQDKHDQQKEEKVKQFNDQLSEINKNHE